MLLAGAVACDSAPTAPVVPGLVVPVLSGIGPIVGVPGSIVEVALTGDHFLPGTIVDVSDDGVVVNGVVVISPTRLSAIFSIAPEASLGVREVRVTTTQGRSAGLTFTVRRGTLPVPTFTAMTPIGQARNTTIAVTLTGTNFTFDSTVAVSGSGVTVGDVTVANSTTIQTTFVITGGATIGDRAVTITTPGGTSGSRMFRILASPPELQSITPASGAQGATLSIRVVGANFSAATAVVVSGVGVTVSGVIVSDEQTLTAMLTIAPDAPVGARSVVVADVGGSSAPRTFTVVAG